MDTCREDQNTADQNKVENHANRLRDTTEDVTYLIQIASTDSSVTCRNSLLISAVCAEGFGRRMLVNRVD